MDLIPAHLKKDTSHDLAHATMDLSACSQEEVAWLLQQKIISIPILVRNLIALKQNGIEQIWLRTSPDQTALRQTLEGHPLVGSSLRWLNAPEPPANSTKDYLHVSPFYLINGIFLEAFKASLDGQQNGTASLYTNQISGDHLQWFSYSHAAPPVRHAVHIDNHEVKGVYVRNKHDIATAEKIIYEDVTRKKGGFITKRLNEPISLRIAKFCALTPITPNQVTVLNTLLGLLAAYWVYLSGKEQTYRLMAAGAILFYLVDIFDGIDGELARFTFRMSKHGALYDTISDNTILVAFLTACISVAYARVGHWWVIATGIFTIFITLAAIFYLLQFTMKHYGNASLRLYEARYFPKIPKNDAIIGYIQWVKHFYTKDVLAAMITAALILNCPLLIVIFAPLLVLQMFVCFAYLGIRYGHLA